MRRLTLPTIILLMVVAGSAATAQKPYPIFTLEDFTTAMKAAGLAFATVNTALGRNDFDTAKRQLTRSRERLAVTITFWRDKKKDDAVKLLRNALTKMDDLDAALSVDNDKIDPTAVNGVAKQVDAACQACHAVYREQDPGTKAYRLKPGSAQ